MTTTVDFKNLNLKDAMDLAILIEEEARERYKEFSDHVGFRYKGDAADFFSSMSANEEKHAQQISAQRKKLFGDAPSSISPDMIWDVEAPDYGKPRPFMSLRQALNIALEAEFKAWTFFDEALKHVKDNDVKALFEELRDEESMHMEAVKKQLALAPEGDGPDLTDDEIDEPSSL